MKPPTHPGPGKTRILLVDDHPIMRRGLAQLINREADLRVDGEATDCATALATATTGHFDLAIVDVSLPDGDGIQLTRQLQERAPRLPVLILSMHDEVLHAERALEAGARGYIRKQEALEQMLVAIRQVLGGRIYLSARMQNRLRPTAVARDPAAPGPFFEQLTSREQAVFRLLGAGHSTRQIADHLQVSVKTVETHLAHIKEKLGLKGVTELLQCATLRVERDAAG